MKKKIKQLGPAWPSIGSFMKKGVELLGLSWMIIVPFAKREVKLLGSLGCLWNHGDDQTSVEPVREPLGQFEVGCDLYFVRSFETRIDNRFPSKAKRWMS